MGREPPTGKAGPGFCLSLAEIELQPVNRGVRKEVENVVPLLFDANFDAESFAGT